MATFSDLEKEYNLLLQNEMATNPTNDIRDQGFFLRCQQRCSMAIRMKYLQQLEQYTGRNAIVYYSTWLQGANLSNPNPELSINDNDINGLMNAVCNLDKAKGLDLLLHTPGGGTTATESIVKYLRKCFANNIRVIVPHMAMSAGTMVACSAKQIIMGKESSLGPIDPQMKGVPAEGILSEFKRAVEETSTNPQMSLMWREIISQYRPTFIGECQNAILLSQKLVEDWLKTGMFLHNKNKEQIVKNILKFLSHDASKQHDKHYDYLDCKEAGLKVVALEKDQRLQDLVLSIHHSYVLSSYAIPSYIKYIENSRGQTFIISGAR